MSIIKLAIFDLDKTVIDSDSMFQFVRYAIRRSPAQLLRLPAIAAHTLLFKLGLLSVESAKRSYFHAIATMTERDLERFYEQVLSRSIYPQAAEEMRKRKQEGCHVLLVTASPHAYAKFFGSLPEVDGVIGTLLAPGADGCGYTSTIEGRNCKGQEKVRRIRRYLEERGLEIDFVRSCAYSDSLSDLPVMELAARKYFINRRVPGAEELRWRR
ncbi:HAD family hydrolase [Saccharibacillus sp. CPCC 101409]|uniref:HAD family hydrolase n=1 Tax=Saccharibacillus sp. CPCC 101409 TaxID=3058041 RepID=UPI002671DEC4|nr:HAD family hydrolase [Saccharibacillus sp. CPCC 101409]MDO3411178.1 HAD family hydrolase [Saccharibacillus sp. CPCC 101409]